MRLRTWISRASRVVGGALGALALSEVAWSQAPEIDTDVQEGLRARPLVSISADQVSRSVVDGFDLNVVITNPQKDIFSIYSIDIALPSGVEGGRDFERAITLEQRQLPAGSQLIKSIRVPRRERRWFEISSWSDLFFVPGDYVIRCTIEFGLKRDQNERRYMQETVKVRLEPPLRSIVIGGATGALLLAIFVPAYRIRDALRSEAWSFLEVLSKFARTLGAGLLSYFVGGTVVTTIAVLLLQRLQDLELPVSLSINDYFGGLALGLFSFKVGDVLHERFFK